MVDGLNFLILPGLARALVPRSVTAALAVPIARALGADTTLTAAAVVLTGTLLIRMLHRSHFATSHAACLY